MDGGELFSRIEESQGFSERGENYRYLNIVNNWNVMGNTLKSGEGEGENSTNPYQLKHKY